MASENRSRLTFPAWLVHAKKSISGSKEWQKLVDKLLPAVDRLCAESYSTTFDKLSDNQKHGILVEAVALVEKSSTCTTAAATVVNTLEDHLRIEVASQRLAGTGAETWTDAIVDLSLDGAASILRRRPQLRIQLMTAYLNRPLPAVLRRTAYQLFLDEHEVTDGFVKAQLDSVRYRSTTERDVLTKLCLDVLTDHQDIKSWDNLSDTVKLMTDVLHCCPVAQTVLNLHTADLRVAGLGKAKVILQLMVPVLAAAFWNSDLRTFSTTERTNITKLLAGEYSSLLSKRPDFMKMMDENNENSSRDICAKVGRRLMKMDRGLAEALTLLGAGSAGREGSYYVPRQDTVLPASLIHGLHELVQPWLCAHFIGYVNSQLLAFIWDQYIMGTGHPGYQASLVAAIVSSLLCLIRGQLTTCSSIEQLKSRGCRAIAKLTVIDLQKTLQQHFYEQLRAELESALAAGHTGMVAVAGSTSVDVLTSFLTRHDLLWDATLLPVARRKYAAPYYYGRRKGALAALKEETGHSRANSVQLLQPEQQRRQQEADVGTGRKLAEFVDAYGSTRTISLRQLGSRGTLHTTASRLLIPPPPSRASMATLVAHAGGAVTAKAPARLSGERSAPRPTPHTQLHPAATSRTAREITLDILSRLAAAFNYVAHDEGTGRQDLNVATALILKQHEKNREQAELAVFGRRLQAGELNRLPADQQEEKKEQLNLAFRDAFMRHIADQAADGTAS